MDILSLIKPEELQLFTENYNYQVSGFMGQRLFPQSKTDNLKIAYRQLVEGQNIPAMAPVHAFNTEASIADRPTFQELELRKLFIKEKLDQDESIEYYLRSLGGTEKGIVEYVFNDVANLVSRVITRTEVMNMELLSTGRVTVKENNLDFVVDFGFNDSNRITLVGWSDPDHDIMADLKKIVAKAKAMGLNLVRAITSSKVVGYLAANKGIQKFWENKSDPMTDNVMLSWLQSNFGIEFITNDAVYKKKLRDTETYRFFDEDTITFLSTRGTIGRGLFGYTPEELKLRDTRTSQRNLVTVTMYEETDPCITWTKASGIYLPVISNINNMIIAKVK